MKLSIIMKVKNSPESEFKKIVKNRKISEETIRKMKIIGRVLMGTKGG